MPELTQQQQAAVDTTAEQTLVVAGAGSGKTRVLTARVERLLRYGASPSGIVAMTFTRRAACELAERVCTAISYGPDPQSGSDFLLGMSVGTIHSFAFDILKTHGDRLGYNTASLTVLEQDDADLLLKQVCRDFGYLDGAKTWKKRLSWKSVTAFRESVYNSGKEPTETTEVFGSDRARIYREYAVRLADLNVVDFGQIILKVLLMMDRKTRIYDVTARIKHVLVDEAQDCNMAQFRLLTMLCPPASLFLVGDTRQSIYAFRGSRPDLLVQMWPNVRLFDLQECFRAGPAIVNAANRLIANNKGTDEPEPPMIAAGPAESHVVSFTGRTANIGGLIKTHDPDSFAYKDIAVLSRNNRDLARIGDQLEAMSVPYQRIGGAFDVCKTDEFKEVHAILRLIANPKDNTAFLRLYTLLGLSSAAYADIRSKAAADRISHWTAYLDRNGLDHFAKAAAAFSPVSSVESFFGSVVLDTGNFWIRHCTGMTIRDALQWFAFRDSQDTLDNEADVVTLSTIHSAKGLEWPVVLVVNMNEGTLPSAMALREDDGLEEERRVAYVAMTRAKEVLYLHYRRPEDQAQDRKIKKPSRFLVEAGFDVSDLPTLFKETADEAESVF